MQENIVKVSEIIDNRYDAYYYRKEFYELKEKLLNNKKSHFGKMAFKLIIYILWYKFINIINHIFLFVFVFTT